MSGAFLSLHTIACRVIVLIHVSRDKSTSRVVGRWSLVAGKGHFRTKIDGGGDEASKRTTIKSRSTVNAVAACAYPTEGRQDKAVSLPFGTSLYLYLNPTRGGGGGRLTAYTRAGDWWRRESFVALPVPGASPSAGCSSNPLQPLRPFPTNTTIASAENTARSKAPPSRYQASQRKIASSLNDRAFLDALSPLFPVSESSCRARANDRQDVHGKIGIR